MPGPSASLAATALTGLLASAPALTGYCAGLDNFPNRPIRLIVPWPPGGGADGTSRILQQRMSENLGQQVVIDNRGGAGGNIGAAMGALTPPDGYTMIFAYSGTHAFNPTLYRDPGFKNSDFAPVTLTALVSNVLVVHPQVPVHSVKELLAYAKTNRVNYASSGSGSANHLMGELFKTMAGIPMTHIPYKGGGPATAAIVGGEVQASFADPLASVPQIKAGRLRALGVSGATRAPGLPDIPPIAELGVPGYDATSWNGMLVPAKTPRPVIDRLNKAVLAALNAPEVRERFLSQAYEPVGSTPEYFGKFIESETIKWGKVIKESGAKVD